MKKFLGLLMFLGLLIPQVASAVPIVAPNVYTSFDYRSFTAALNTMGSQNSTLVISTPLAVNSTATVPSNVKLQFLPGGNLYYGPQGIGAITLTINGPIDASPGSAIFVGSNLSAVINLATTPSTYSTWGTFTTTGTRALNSSNIIQFAITTITGGSTVINFPTHYTSSSTYTLFAETYGVGGTTSVTQTSGTSAKISTGGANGTKINWWAIGN